jgi:glycosyltransferase involved in cell wall biosynthesis
MVMPKAVLVIAGDGPLRGELQGLARDLRCAGSVRFVGRRDDVAAVLRAGDLFVLPSRYEGCSNSVLEAMATALPVIATDVGGTGELIEPNHTGWLVPPEHPHRLAETITAALLDRVARERVGRMAREAVLERFTLAQMRDTYARFYRAVAVAESDARLRTEAPTCAG